MGAYASHRYLTTFDDSAAHVRYIGFREREDKSESLGLFSEHSDNADADEFIESLKAKRLKHPDVPVIHTVLFSMSGDEWQRSGFEPGDYQKMIRHVMKEWEIKMGYRLQWVAAEHRNPDHPHCHVAIRAAYKDRDGVEHRLKISNEDRKFFREQFQKTKEMFRPIDPPPRERNYEYERTPNLNIDTSFVDNLFYKLQREIEQEEFQREFAKKKAKNKERTR
ncbi:relaxase/mobilization nuclease domain-containing protein [Heyndrickxia acidicola]|uniref:Relaxase/mobilization nuclease domain-containing protein n=1 Tax=Heyndrickxia acidicola TaxID=209389 RepID=A0ABU6MMG5_9BACI|nr:relaxase/mobilization nuclease domain-containing protein [Heyndrickxia acidicola]MED1205597.1 relaxase/mobilization nuclease domain-containing protein [Heyndrickxia acidicola]